MSNPQKNQGLTATKGLTPASILVDGVNKRRKDSLHRFFKTASGKGKTMSLIRRNTTGRIVAANRANSLKSNGPRTELGKRRSSRNAGKHLIWAKVEPAFMKELGEDPEEFRKLRKSLWESFCPQDGLEATLVDGMAHLQWRLLRARRAEAGILARQKRELEIQRELGARPRTGIEVAAGGPLVERFGLSSVVASYRRASEVLEALIALRDTIEFDGFLEKYRIFIEVVFGKEGGIDGRHLMIQFNECCKEQVGECSREREQKRKDFIQDLDLQIATYRRLTDLYRERDVDTPKSKLDAQLLPKQEDLDRILPYEARLERLFERKLQQLVAWRRTKDDGAFSTSKSQASRALKSEARVVSRGARNGDEVFPSIA